MSIDDGDQEFLNWSINQNLILTGGGTLNNILIPGRDFVDEDLPHFVLRSNRSWEIFASWKDKKNESTLIVGAWARTIFAGGWNESSLMDTEAFNLQSPTIFIDLRFPISRPKHLSFYNSLSAMTLEDLKLLSRQHCFGGYSFPHETNTYNPPIFTRHHIIDWNYHPKYPRPRPNRWWVEIKDDRSSFKEYSVARDKHDVPLYFERWVRYIGDSNGSKYLALRRESDFTARDALIVVVGNHFAMAYDRKTPFPDFVGSTGPGGSALVDYAIGQIRQGDSTAERMGRESLERYLDLEGSYGRLQGTEAGTTWTVTRSTHPWREGHSLWDRIDEATESPCLPRLDFLLSGELRSMSWRGKWRVLECSFSVDELISLFRSPIQAQLPQRSFL